MKALTVRQPWAWAIVHGSKDVENRSRNLAGSYRGPVAIHAGLREDDAAYYDEMIREDLAHADSSWVLQELTGITGAFVGVVDLVAVHHESDHGPGGRCSWWGQRDQWHLEIRNARPLADPIPAKGRLGLWTPDAELVATIREQVPS